MTTARMSFSVLTKMVSVWGGPDIAPLQMMAAAQKIGPDKTAQPPNSPNDNQRPCPVVPGFGEFAIRRFSPLSWAIPSGVGFNPSKDFQARNLVHEIANMQQEMYKKTGQMYLEALAQELGSMGLGQNEIGAYVGKVSSENRAFREYLCGFLTRAEQPVS